MGSKQARGRVAESTCRVDMDSGVSGARKHGGNLRLPLYQNMDTFAAVLSENVHPQRTPKRDGFAKSDRYEMLTVVMKKGSHLAAEGEVTEVKTESGETTLALTDEAAEDWRPSP